VTAAAPEPDPNAHRLSVADHLDIFQTVIVPAAYADGIRQEQPRILLLGGQTGAGKSVMKSSLTADSRWIRHWSSAATPCASTTPTTSGC
jgi:hypothetical protein